MSRFRPANGDSLEAVDEHVIRLSLPYEHGFVNCYLVNAPDGLRLIDTGPPADIDSAPLVEHLRLLGVELTNVKAILLTHAHQDHVGMAAAIAGASGAKIFIHEREVTGDSAFANLQPPLQWLRKHGLPPASEQVEREQTHLPQQVHLLKGNEVIGFGSLDLELHWTPGHSPGLLCAYERERGWLFTSDHLLRTPTPLAIRQHIDADPVREYLDSLDSITSLPARLALPGHGRTFADVAGAIRVARETQLRWLVEVYEAVPVHGAVAIEIAEKLPWLAVRNRPNSWLSISRSVAYLQHLEAIGRLRREGNSLVKFLPAGEGPAYGQTKRRRIRDA